MFEDEEKQGKQATPGGVPASESTKQEPEHAAPPRPVPVPSPKYAGMRRSQRVYLRTAVAIYGQGPTGNLYQEDTHTVIVNSHGALVLIAADVKLDEKLLVVCQQTLQESECSVVWIGELKESKREVGIGFLAPNPRFWGLTFPPDDWDPAKRKLPPRKTP